MIQIIYNVINYVVISIINRIHIIPIRVNNSEITFTIFQEF